LSELNENQTHTVKCMLIPLFDDRVNRNVEVDLPTVPRIGEHVEIEVDGVTRMYLVMGVAYSSFGLAYVDVYVQKDCSLADFIARLRPWPSPDQCVKGKGTECNPIRPMPSQH
jgi:hypothetical protein